MVNNTTALKHAESSPQGKFLGVPLDDQLNFKGHISQGRIQKF